MNIDINDFSNGFAPNTSPIPDRFAASAYEMSPSGRLGAACGDFSLDHFDYPFSNGTSQAFSRFDDNGEKTGQKKAIHRPKCKPMLKAIQIPVLKPFESYASAERAVQIIRSAIKGKIPMEAAEDCRKLPDWFLP